MTDHLLDRLDLQAVPPGAWPACRCDGDDIIQTIRDGVVRDGPQHELGCPGDRPVRILEPCVGEANIVNAIWRKHPETIVWTWDIDPRHHAGVTCDAREDRWWAAHEAQDGRPDWVITNPPFSAAFDIIREAYEAATVGIAMLLRVTWLEPTKTGARAAWLAEHPPTWELIMERYSFDGAGQDSATTAWFVWIKNERAAKILTDKLAPHGRQHIEVIPGRGRQAAGL
jgi:hypothetical protein